MDKGEEDEKMVVEESRGAGSSSSDIEFDNSNSVLLKIASLYAEKLMNDVSLLVGGHEYPAHKLILCASSEVFSVMLMNPQWSESRESKVVLKETPSCAAEFGKFLTYLYTGRIRINQSSVMPILGLADKYNVKDLIYLCLDYMCNHIAQAFVHNQLISWFQYTLSLGHYQVALVCENFLKWNLEKVSEISDFGNIHPEIMAKLLQHNDLVVVNEISLYSCVVRWLEIQERILMAELPAEEVEAQLSSFVEQTMINIRFPMMTPRQLAQLLLSPLVKRFKEFFIERMAMGMSFHSGQADRIRKICQEENGNLLFTPRLYTASEWSSVLTVENFTSLPAYQSRTLVFTSQVQTAEHEGDKTCEWVVDFYPKGIWFQKCYLIVWEGTINLPELILKTVRLSITCKDPPCNPDDLRVKIGILISGVQDDVEHIMWTVQKVYRFNDEERLLNFDDLMSYAELNDNLNLLNREAHSSDQDRSKNKESTSGDQDKSKVSPFLVGPNRDTLKIHISVTPLFRHSGTEPI